MDASNQSSIAQPPQNIPVAIKTKKTPDVSGVMIVVDARAHPIRPLPKTNWAIAFVQVIVLLLRQPVDPLYTSPSGLLFLVRCHRRAAATARRMTQNAIAPMVKGISLFIRMVPLLEREAPS